MNAYGSMRMKVGMFKHEGNARPPTEDIYRGWRSALEGSEATYWNIVTARFDEYFQLSVLRAVSVAGISTDCWGYVFMRIAKEMSPFQDVTRLYLQGLFDFDWRYFADKLTRDSWYPDRYFPCVRPEWLFPYGYAQQDYLDDLAVYWDDIHEGYKTPWHNAPIKRESPDIVRLKRLGQAARDEIDQVARHSDKYLKREEKR